MSNNTEAIVSIEEYEEDSDLGPDDFSFVISGDGELKSFMIPEHLMDDPPEEITLILKLFGIDDIHELGCNTLH
jgi:hypothetical protein